MAVLDASFIVKLVVNEECSDTAISLYEELAEKGEELHAPYIVLTEVLNAIWKHLVLLGDIDVGDAEKSLRLLEAITKVLTLHYDMQLLMESFRLAVSLRIPVYDSFYLALAKRLGQPLYTFDRSLVRKLEAKADLRELVVVPACHEKRSK